MRAFKAITTTTLALISLLAAGCAPTGDDACGGCPNYLWLSIYFTYETSGTHTFVLNGESHERVVPGTDRPEGRFVVILMDAPLPETVSIQVYDQDTLKLDTTITPDYQPTLDECLQTIEPTCLTAYEDVYVTEG